MENSPHPPLAGLDPADLLKQGVAADTFADDPAPFNPPAINELAPHFPQFEILELIGKGGMGAVYKVRQPELDRIVALKILPPAIGETAGFAERFAREAKALAKLNHPGIVTIHEFGQASSSQLSTPNSQPPYFILMEFVDGVNLAQLMQTGRIAPREALAIVPQICDALQFAHDQGIVHRDIKPENILLDRLGRVKVADFGIAKVVAAVCDRADSDEERWSQTTVTLAGKIMGTPQYMAPEQIDSPAEVDHRADIYALGVVFYQMLTGELPGKELLAPSRKFLLDVRLDEVVMHALEKNPELRYQQARIFKTQVETIANTPQASAKTELETEPLASARGRIVFDGSPVFPVKGEVSLYPDHLMISSGPEKHQIPLANVIGLGHSVMPRWFIPSGHRYASVDFEQAGLRRTIQFSPGTTTFRSGARITEDVKDWLTAVQEQVKSSSGKLLPISETPVQMTLFTSWATWVLMLALVGIWAGWLLFGTLLFPWLPFMGPVIVGFGVVALRSKPLRWKNFRDGIEDGSRGERRDIRKWLSSWRQVAGGAMILCVPISILLGLLQKEELPHGARIETVFRLPEAAPSEFSRAALKDVLEPYSGQYFLKGDGGLYTLTVSDVGLERTTATTGRIFDALRLELGEPANIIKSTPMPDASISPQLTSEFTQQAYQRRLDYMRIGVPIGSLGLSLLAFGPIRNRRSSLVWAGWATLVFFLSGLLIGWGYLAFVETWGAAWTFYTMIGVLASAMMFGIVAWRSRLGRTAVLGAWILAFGLFLIPTGNISDGGLRIGLPASYQSTSLSRSSAPVRRQVMEHHGYYPEPSATSLGSEPPASGGYSVAASVSVGVEEVNTEPLSAVVVPLATAWLGFMDHELYPDTWRMASAYFQAAASEEKWVDNSKRLRQPLGKLESRKLSDFKIVQLENKQLGVAEFRSQFSGKKGVLETVSMEKDGDGSWRVSGYFFK
ncbi:MAG: protein kinase [Verrucomicrobiota bacterium]